MAFYLVSAVPKQGLMEELPSGSGATSSSP